MLLDHIKALFHVDILSIIMIVLVNFIGIIVYCFSRTYMKGDQHYRYFLRNMCCLLTSIIIMTMADNLFLFLSAWCCCNWMLVKLIVHKSTWQAAKASGSRAAQNFILGFIFVMLAFALMYHATGSFSIQYIIHHAQTTGYMLMALILLLLGAMTQSAIWPFQGWLISSLNAPTPVSAIMHAGIVNGGGFLLARFAPLYFNAPALLDIIFIVGIATALLGSLWKLMQHDVKRMLGCSTMGQMGFMLAQCGLGLFAAALAHLCWHGMFKAYLFLASGGAAQEKRLDLGYPPSLICFLFALVCGALGSYLFAIISHINFIPTDTRLIVVGIVFIAGSQLALTLLRGAAFKIWPLAMLATALLGLFYGVNVYLFDELLSPLNLMQAQPLNAVHISAMFILIFAWLCILFIRYANYKSELPDRLLKSYVKTLNQSQPHPTTITTHRKGYDYV